MGTVELLAKPCTSKLLQKIVHKIKNDTTLGVQANKKLTNDQPVIQNAPIYFERINKKSNFNKSTFQNTDINTVHNKY